MCVNEEQGRSENRKNKIQSSQADLFLSNFFLRFFPFLILVAIDGRFHIFAILRNKPYMIHKYES